MSEGDKAKQPEGCNEHASGCQNMKETEGGGMSWEHYRCDVCGASYRLYYEDMK